jgi:hypothetical protein
MSTERELDKILAEIGREHRAIGAPERLETVLCAAVAGRKRAAGISGLRLAFTVAAVMILLAAVVGGAVLWQMRMSHPSQIQQAGSVPKSQPGSIPMRDSSSGSEPRTIPAKSARVRSVARSRTGVRDTTQPRTWNSLDEFVPLPASESLPAAAELSVVRMKLRGSDLQQYGLQTPADAAGQTMLAEFVVGEDGLPRAIRIVR